MNSFSVIFIEFDLLVVFSGLVVSTELGISVIVSNIASKTLITLSLPKSDKLSKLEMLSYTSSTDSALPTTFIIASLTSLGAFINSSVVAILFFISLNDIPESSIRVSVFLTISFLDLHPVKVTKVAPISNIDIIFIKFFFIIILLF